MRDNRYWIKVFATVSIVDAVEPELPEPPDSQYTTMNKVAEVFSTDGSLTECDNNTAIF